MNARIVSRDWTTTFWLSSPPPPDHYETELSATRDALVAVGAMFDAEVNYDEIEESVEALPEYKHMLYFVPCLLPKEACIDALRRRSCPIVGGNWFLA